MKNVIVITTLQLLLVFNTSVLAQKADVKIDPLSAEPMIVIKDAAFGPMCKEFSTRIGGATASGAVSFKPKVVEKSRADTAGRVWVIMTGNMNFEVRSSELPAYLRKLQGPAAMSVKRATCYLEDNHFFKTTSIMIIMMTNEDAVEVVKTLQR